MRSARLLVTLVLAALATAAPARAHLPATITTTVPPGGNSTVTSPTLPPGAKSLKVTMAPADPENDDLFNHLQFVFAGQPRPGQRLLTCLTLYFVASDTSPDREGPAQFTEPDSPFPLLLLTSCLKLAGLLDHSLQARSAAAGCGREAVQVPATYTRSGKRYSASVDGTPVPLRKRTRLKVSCKRKGGAAVLRARPAKRGATLRSVVGSRFLVGVYNPANADGSPTVKVTFSR